MAVLDLTLDSSQGLLRDTIQRLLADTPEPQWQDLVDQLGLSGLTVPEAEGGFGGQGIDVALAMGELGAALAGADWLSHAAACWVLAKARPDHPALAALAAGERRGALVSAATARGLDLRGADVLSGSATLVAGGATADLLVVATPESVALVDACAPRIARRNRAMHDGSEVADLEFTNTPATVLATGAQAEELASAARALVRTGRCAEAVGLMQRMIADTADYIAQRKQFGAVIGSFQALRHRLADMQLIAMQAAALTEVAAEALAGPAAERDLAISAACVAVRDAARKVGEGAVQLHGAMGLTEELRLGARFKRSLAIAAALGGETELLNEFAELA